MSLSEQKEPQHKVRSEKHKRQPTTCRLFPVDWKQNTPICNRRTRSCVCSASQGCQATTSSMWERCMVVVALTFESYALNEIPHKTLCKAYVRLHVQHHTVDCFLRKKNKQARQCIFAGKLIAEMYTLHRCAQICIRHFDRKRYQRLLKYFDSKHVPTFGVSEKKQPLFNLQRCWPYHSKIVTWSAMVLNMCWCLGRQIASIPTSLNSVTFAQNRLLWHNVCRHTKEIIK